MTDIPTFWQAFEAVGRIVLMILGAVLPVLLVSVPVLSAIDHRAAIKHRLLAILRALKARARGTLGYCVEKE